MNPNKKKKSTRKRIWRWKKKETKPGGGADGGKKKISTVVVGHRHDSYPPATGPSRSTLCTTPPSSPLSLTKFPKYFLATSLSLHTFTVSSRRTVSFSTERCKPRRRLSAGKCRTFRTSLETRSLFWWT